MRIQPIDFGRPGALLTGLYDVFAPAYAKDDPGPVMSGRRFAHEVSTGGSGARAEAWVIAEDGEVTGGYGLSFPESGNTHMAWLFPLVVRPEAQGRGLGTALFDHAVERMRANGRRLLLSESPVTGVGARFARARGMTVSLALARRVLDLRKVDWSAFERMRPDVPGYHLRSWTGPAPDELLPTLATLMSGMNDAPRDSDLADDSFDVARMREHERNLTLSGRTGHTTIALRDSDGAPAGLTRINFDADRSSGWAGQSDTTVLREHRGRRLGLLLKLANAIRLHEHEPHLERVITWNATVNAHMLAVNEAMGFELLDEWNEWRLEV
ncbi:GNAT family N-acetyltransferase [Nonomuraea sp. NN258]|uniref:GNAT family N-acetyltransferase n=1 Tax=Nonomuraea antri TaxID=2730852 RepID=UPI0015683E10|nr:GNAT family N-acetyltransferase [Nonomuraea antri]NRQ35625.1 GNAT family N-acetyltransferase [Nonomuraea antri]